MEVGTVAMTSGGGGGGGRGVFLGGGFSFFFFLGGGGGGGGGVDELAGILALPLDDRDFAKAFPTQAETLEERHAVPDGDALGRLDASRAETQWQA